MAGCLGEKILTLHFLSCRQDKTVVLHWSYVHGRLIGLEITGFQLYNCSQSPSDNFRSSLSTTVSPRLHIASLLQRHTRQGKVYPMYKSDINLHIIIGLTKFSLCSSQSVNCTATSPCCVSNKGKHSLYQCVLGLLSKAIYELHYETYINQHFISHYIIDLPSK